MVSMFSHWTEAFPCKQATGSSVANVLSEKIKPIWGIPLKFHNDPGAYLLLDYFG